MRSEVPLSAEPHYSSEEGGSSGSAGSAPGRSESSGERGPGRGRVRLAVALAATLVVVVPLVWLWAASLVPGSYSIDSMGAPDYGGAVVASGHQHPSTPGDPGSSAGSGDAAPRSVTDLVETQQGRPDVAVRLTARRERVSLAGGPSLTAYTLNGTTPGPTIRAAQGDLVEVTLVNESVSGGTTLHWHGLDVPNAEDGVAGVTQDAVPVGGSRVYRFVARQAGTYWYHSHQVSHEQVVRGMLGAIVIAPAGEPAAAPAGPPDKVLDVVALSHLYSGRRTVQGRVGGSAVTATPGQQVRARVINTDNGIMPVWVSGASYRVLAVDGTDVHEPGEVTGRSVLVPAGGRVDLGFTVPASGAARVEFSGAALVVGPVGSRGVPTRAPKDSVDLLSYGTPAPLPFAVSEPDRRFEYSMGRRPGFVRGKPGVQWTVNGKTFPDMPMFMVADGDVVTMRISNTSGEAHPMHLHGHHVVVLSRNGTRASGSPWWTDSLEVASGDRYEVAFLADNPGIWLDHCHNLPHAQEGLIAHLMYQGVTTPFRLGADTANEPE